MPPIKPTEVAKRKEHEIPDGVFDVFNAMIAAAWNGRSATIKESDVALEIADKFQISTEEVYKRHWLDVEDAYKRAGWRVRYDKPGYNETYPATFEFTSAMRGSS